MTASAVLTDSPRSFLRAKPRASHRGRKLAALALALGVPAVAAPAEWRSLDLFGSEEAKAASPLGFEVAGESFPGSAFYYLADEPSAFAAAPVGGTFAVAQPGAADPAIGPAARPIALAGSAIDKARALQCMTMAIYYEAATESDAGQRAVAQVVLNRVTHPAYPNTVCGVVFQGSERSTGCQFSFTCDGSLARAPARKFWDRAQRVAMAALAGSVYRPVGLATHYHTVQIHPYWADSLNNITTIGAHTFYRWRGAAGLPAAFTQAYYGAEPLPQRHRPTAAPDLASLADPIELARRYEATLANSQAATPVSARGGASAPAQSTQNAPAPAYSTEIEARGGETLYSGNRLPAGGEVKSQYQQSGQWIGRP
ncbi:cell wall hydrolase [Altererythrobacter fulvus]|uniref:cell wall hydrolase n=1 Tax=Caenibius fulvus TaxID=2126012 RepID=UPI003019CE31